MYLTVSAYLSRHESYPRCKLSRAIERREISDSCHQRRCRQVPNTWDLLNRLHLSIFPDHGAQPLAELVNVGLQGFNALERLLHADDQVSAQLISLLGSVATSD